MRIYIILLLILNTSGCLPEYLVKRDSILIPVSSCAEPPVFIPFTLPISDVSTNTSDADVVRKFAASIEILKGEIMYRDLIIDSYRSKNE